MGHVSGRCFVTSGGKCPNVKLIKEDTGGLAGCGLLYCACTVYILLNECLCSKEEFSHIVNIVNSPSDLYLAGVDCGHTKGNVLSINFVLWQR